MIDSVPTESVVFAIPLDTSLMTVQLNIFLPRSRPRSLGDLSSVTTRGLIIEPGAQLYKGGNVTILFPHRSILLSLILVVYLLGEVDVITPILLFSSFTPYLPFASLTFLWTWLTPKLSLSQQLIFPAFHKILHCSISFLVFVQLGLCALSNYLNT